MDPSSRKTLFSDYFQSLETKASDGFDANQGNFLWSGMKYTDQEDEREEVEKHVDNQSPMVRFEKATRISLEILDKVRDQLNWLEISQRCIYCQQKYSPKLNMGFMKCRWHPDPALDLLNYSCCGEKRDIFKHSGCKRCDHTSQSDGNGRWNEKNKIEPIPLIVAIELKIPSPNYTVTDAYDVRKTKALVKRCEF
jgi:hypothetical protein